jgi:hypothetical protein
MRATIVVSGAEVSLIAVSRRRQACTVACLASGPSVFV